jgi:uncharacterized membrane protein
LAWLQKTDGIRTTDVLRLAEQGLLDARAVGRALQLAGRAPTASGWRTAADRLLLGVGAALLVAGVICLVAYNWSEMQRWGRFALAQAVLLLVFLLAVRLGPGSRYGKVVLTVAIGLIGPLLALFGQTYQTGADTYELFRSWALLALPWVLASSFAPAWLLWLVVVQAALVMHVAALDLWWRIWFGFAPSWLLASAFNLLVLVLWEYFARRRDWLAGRLGPRIIATCLTGLLTGLTCAVIFSAEAPGLGLAPFAWILLMVAGFVAYRIRGIDLVMLALGWLSLTCVLLAASGRLLFEFDAGVLVFVLAAAVLVASSALGRQWLRNVAAMHTAGNAPDMAQRR